MIDGPAGASIGGRTGRAYTFVRADTRTFTAEVVRGPGVDDAPGRMGPPGAERRADGPRQDASGDGAAGGRDGPGWPRPPGRRRWSPTTSSTASARLPGAVDHARAEAERIRAGRFAFFGYPEVTLEPGFDWHSDPITGHAWPRRHWSSIDHRVADADPKWLWELGRHQHVVHLARAWRLTGDDGFAEAAAGHLDGFIAQDPPGTGIHWRVGLELGMRLTSWAWIVELLRGSPVATPELGGALLASADAHLAQLERYPSLYSSANNHRIGELAGLAIGCALLPRATRIRRGGPSGPWPRWPPSSDGRSTRTASTPSRRRPTRASSSTS